MHVAAQCGHVDMVGLLLERGAGANVQSKNGLTALHLAAQDDRTPIARLLTRYGAIIDPQTKASCGIFIIIIIIIIIIYLFIKRKKNK